MYAIYGTLIAGLFMGIVGMASVSAQAPRADKLVQDLGVVARVDPIKVGRGFDATRLTMTDGKTYTVYNSLQGVEKSTLQYVVSHNDVARICGGLPRNCQQTVN